MVLAPGARSTTSWPFSSFSRWLDRPSRSGSRLQEQVAGADGVIAERAAAGLLGSRVSGVAANVRGPSLQYDISFVWLPAGIHHQPGGRSPRHSQQYLIELAQRRISFGSRYTSARRYEIIDEAFANRR